MWRQYPGLMFLGLIPGLIAAALVAIALASVAINLDAITEWLTRFADGWPNVFAALVHVLATIGLIWAVGLTVVYGFTSLTMIIGQPFFEAISRRVSTALRGKESFGI